MHVSGGSGRSYRSHFRRDWATGQAYPNLWPYRVKMGAMFIGGFPSDLFEGMEETLSNVGVVSYGPPRITYTWENSFLGDTATFTLTEFPGGMDREQGWVYLFTENTAVGFLRLEVSAYLLDDEESHWQITSPFPSGSWAATAIGEFSGFVYAPPDPLIEFFAARWEELPMDERTP